MSQGRALDDVPQAALLMVSRGLDVLAPAEANEMRAIYQQVWAPVPRGAAGAARRAHGRAQGRARGACGRRDPGCASALKVGVLALPPADRERLQELSGRAVRKSLLRAVRPLP